MGWFRDFHNECKAWRIVRREYRKYEREFLAVGLKSDWFGKLYRVINRDPSIELESGEDEVYLRKELSEIWAVLVKHNLVDILAYELKPLNEETEREDGMIEYEHGYLVVFTPAWKLDKQYVTVKSVIFVILFYSALLAGATFAVIKYLIPFIQSFL